MDVHGEVSSEKRGRADQCLVDDSWMFMVGDSGDGMVMVSSR